MGSGKLSLLEKQGKLSLLEEHGQSFLTRPLQHLLPLGISGAVVQGGGSESRVVTRQVRGAFVHFLKGPGQAVVHQGLWEHLHKRGEHSSSQVRSRRYLHALDSPYTLRVVSQMFSL